MNIKRLLSIAQEADKIGDFVTADRVTNLLKTAQGQYSVYPNQAAYERSAQLPEEKTFYNQLLSRIQNLHKYNDPNRRVEISEIQSIINSNSKKYPSIKNLQPYVSMDKMNAKNTSYQLQNYEQQKKLEQIEKAKYIMGVPTSYEASPVTTYYAPVAPGATQFTPGVVNVAQPHVSQEQKAFADLRGLRQQVVPFVAPQRPTNYPVYQTYQQPVYQGTNTQAQYNFNPNAPTNMNLYGTGYASKAMQPQQAQPQQAQPSYNPQQQSQQPIYNQRRGPAR